MPTFRINILELNEHTSAILQLLKTEKFIEIIEEEADSYSEKLIAQANEAEEAYKNGEYISQEDLKVKSQKW